MIFIKKVNILQLLLLALVFNACNQKNKSIEKTAKTTEEPIQDALKKGPKLSDTYTMATHQAIAHFCNKNWPNNSLNGSVLVAKNGHIIYEKYQGIANYSTKQPMDSTTALHIASVSKVMTATAVLQLIGANKISLDQKVNSILKNFPYPEITIQTLLNHRSGMRNYAYFTEKKGVWDRHKILRNTDIVTIMATKAIALEFKTNTRFSYCNTNYAVLALIIEKITGLSYSQAMTNLIFKPLKMHNTYVFDYDRDKDVAVPSYRGNFSKVNLDYLDAIYGDKNIYSTPRDLLKFDQGRNAAVYLDPKLLQQAFIGYSNEHRGKNNYGLGIRMINWPTGQNFYFHNGWWHGNTSSYITLPKEAVTIVALSNKMTRKTYKVRNLAVLFGAYPFQLEDNAKEE
ncbi:serine hydrolase domain-containing protein [Flavobacterium crassostreae]|uniref:Penicillin-binding protein n=1 Tax=Flavobacterium crassostreae TaxID=1763534 RepID=A0A1B9E951_9FLAO|nr:serine hydrolase domain-containing protein [Flavobacterium crassostreae]OCB78500.1 penicillin-binding protein [Flavobacterium crassostreae]